MLVTFLGQGEDKSTT